MPSLPPPAHQAAKNALEVGFHGVELHAANGVRRAVVELLVHSFVRAFTNPNPTLEF